MRWGSRARVRLVVGAAAVLLTAGTACSGPASTPPIVDGVRVIPATSLLPLVGGADLPDPARVLLVEADERFRAGDDAGALEAAKQAQADPSPRTQALASVIAGVALANQGRPDEALDQLHCEQTTTLFSGGLADDLAPLCWSARASSYSQKGEPTKVAKTLAQAVSFYADEPIPVFVHQLCLQAEARGAAGACTRIRPTTTPAPPTTTASGPVPTSTTIPTTSSPRPTRTSGAPSTSRRPTWPTGTTPPTSVTTSPETSSTTTAPP